MFWRIKKAFFPTGAEAGGHGEVVKRFADDAAPAVAGLPSITFNGAIAWPMAPGDLLALYLASSEHGRCCRLKAEGAFGRGLAQALPGAGKEIRYEAIPAVEALCEGGSAGLFVALGLDLEIYGNAFLYVQRLGSKIVRLAHRPAATMARHVDGGFVQVLYGVDGKEAITRYQAEEIIHLRPPCPYGGFYALPTWISSSDLMGLVKAATRYNSKFFDNGAMPEYAAIIKGRGLTPEQRRATRDFFQNEYRGLDNAHRTLVLDFDDPEIEVKFERLTGDIKDGDFLKLLDAARERILSAHGVPPRMVGIVAAGQLGGGGEVIGQLHTFEELTLMPIKSRTIRQLAVIWRALGIDSETLAFVPIDLTPPEDRNTDLGYLSDWVQAGVISTEEARRLAGFSGTGIGKSAALQNLVNLWKSL